MSLLSMLDFEKSSNINQTNQTSLLFNGKTKNININNSTNNDDNLLIQQKLLINSLKNDYLNQLIGSSGGNIQKLLQNASNNQQYQSSSLNTGKQINYARYKTELCRQFNENGDCKYGDKCQFAHGPIDLKDVNRHPKYKTDFCKTFHSKGFCPYGPRCHFLHDLNEKFEPNNSLNNSINHSFNHPHSLQTTSNHLTPTKFLSQSLSNYQFQHHMNQSSQQENNDDLESYVASLSILSSSSTDESSTDHESFNQNSSTSNTSKSSSPTKSNKTPTHNTTETNHNNENVAKFILDDDLNNNMFALSPATIIPRTRSLTSSTSSAYSTSSYLSTASSNSNE